MEVFGKPVEIAKSSTKLGGVFWVRPVRMLTRAADCSEIDALLQVGGTHPRHCHCSEGVIETRCA
jgi:hypothetical protein